MNQETIPDNNLPVYLQKYDVKIFDDKKESVGKVLYTTVGAIPSNEKEKRVWSLNLTGYLKPNVDKYNIVYDFSKVDYKYKDKITFENIVSGTFNICGHVLDASKIIGFDYKYNDEESTLTIELDTSKWDFRLKKEVLFSYDLNVDDTSANIVCCQNGENALTINLDTAYNLYLQLGSTNTTGCLTRSCDTNNNILIESNNKYYQSFKISGYSSFDTLSIVPYGVAYCLTNSANCSINLTSSECCDGNNSDIALVYDGTCSSLENDVSTNIIGGSGSQSLYATYTYSSSLNPCSASTCQGDSLSDYYLGTIEFSITSSS